MKNGSPRAGVPEPHVLHRTTHPNSGSEENIVDLLKQLAGQGSHLAEQQLALIKAEMRETATELKLAAGSMGAAAVVGIAGLGVTLMGIAYFVGQALDNIALGTVIVGVVTLALAYLLYRGGASKISAARLTPDRTERTLKRTPDAVRGDLPTGETR